MRILPWRLEHSQDARPAAAPRVFAALRAWQGLPGPGGGLCAREPPSVSCLLLPAEGGAVLMPQRSPGFSNHSFFPCVVFICSWKGVRSYRSAPFRSIIVQPRGSLPEHTSSGWASAGPSLPRACGSVLSGLSPLPVSCVWHHAESGPRSSCRLALSPQSLVGPSTPRWTPLASGALFVCPVRKIPSGLQPLGRPHCLGSSGNTCPFLLLGLASRTSYCPVLGTVRSRTCTCVSVRGHTCACVCACVFVSEWERQYLGAPLGKSG